MPIKYFLPLGLAAGLLAGCAPTLAPHITYLPAVRSRGEVEVGGNTGLAGSQVVVGYQASKSVVLNGALLGFDRDKSGAEFRSAELGIGYYRPLPNNRWRIGLHAGGVVGRGYSGYDNFCFDICGNIPKTYRSRYFYGYVQPTILLTDGNLNAAFGMRIGQTHYSALDEQRSYFLLTGGNDSTVTISHAGHRSTFAQPTMQLSYRVTPWLALSGSLGIQFFVGQRSALNDMVPLIGQGGLHFILGAKPAAEALR